MVTNKQLRYNLGAWDNFCFVSGRPFRFPLRRCLCGASIVSGHNTNNNKTLENTFFRHILVNSLPSSPHQADANKYKEKIPSIPSITLGQNAVTAAIETTVLIDSLHFNYFSHTLNWRPEVLYYSSSGHSPYIQSRANLTNHSKDATVGGICH